MAAAALLAGCTARAASPGESEGRVRLVATMSILGDLAREVGGDRVAVEALVPIGGDPHIYEPTPSDSAAISDADVVVSNGLGLAPGLDPLVEPADHAVRLSAGLEDALLPWEDEDFDHDPHLWMVPGYAAHYGEVIAAALAEVDAEHAAGYRQRAAELADELAALDAELAERLDAIPPQRRVLVTSHDAYSYFAEHYDLELHSAVGVTTEEEPSAQRVRELIDLVEERAVPAVFFETTVNPAVIERIARDAGARIGAPLYGDSVGEPGSGAETYTGMMRANVEALVEGLAEPADGDGR